MHYSISPISIPSVCIKINRHKLTKAIHFMSKQINSFLRDPLNFIRQDLNLNLRSGRIQITLCKPKTRNKYTEHLFFTLKNF